MNFKYSIFFLIAIPAFFLLRTITGDPQPSFLFMITYAIAQLTFLILTFGILFRKYFSVKQIGNWFKEDFWLLVAIAVLRFSIVGRYSLGLNNDQAGELKLSVEQLSGRFIFPFSTTAWGLPTFFDTLFSPVAWVFLHTGMHLNFLHIIYILLSLISIIPFYIVAKRIKDRFVAAALIIGLGLSPFSIVSSFVHYQGMLLLTLLMGSLLFLIWKLLSDVEEHRKLLLVISWLLGCMHQLYVATAPIVLLTIFSLVVWFTVRKQKKLILDSVAPYFITALPLLIYAFVQKEIYSGRVRFFLGLFHQEVLNHGLLNVLSTRAQNISSGFIVVPGLTGRWFHDGLFRLFTPQIALFPWIGTLALIAILIHTIRQCGKNSSWKFLIPFTFLFIFILQPILSDLHDYRFIPVIGVYWAILFLYAAEQPRARKVKIFATLLLLETSLHFIKFQQTASAANMNWIFHPNHSEMAFEARHLLDKGSKVVMLQNYNKENAELAFLGTGQEPFRLTQGKMLSEMPAESAFHPDRSELDQINFIIAQDIPTSNHLVAKIQETLPTFTEVKRVHSQHEPGTGYIILQNRK